MFISDFLQKYGLLVMMGIEKKNSARDCIRRLFHHTSSRSRRSRESPLLHTDVESPCDSAAEPEWAEPDQLTHVLRLFLHTSAMRVVFSYQIIHASCLFHN